MTKPSTKEIHAAIAAFIKQTNEPFAITAKRLKISVSTVRRVASEFHIHRRRRLDVSVLDTIQRESGNQNDAHGSYPGGTSSRNSDCSHEGNTDTGGHHAEL